MQLLWDLTTYRRMAKCVGGWMNTEACWARTFLRRRKLLLAEPDQHHETVTHFLSVSTLTFEIKQPKCVLKSRPLTCYCCYSRESTDRRVEESKNFISIYSDNWLTISRFLPLRSENVSFCPNGEELMISLVPLWDQWTVSGLLQKITCRFWSVQVLLVQIISTDELHSVMCEATLTV